MVLSKYRFIWCSNNYWGSYWLLKIQWEKLRAIVIDHNLAYFKKVKIEWKGSKMRCNNVNNMQSSRVLHAQGWNYYHSDVIDWANKILLLWACKIQENSLIFRSFFRTFYYLSFTKKAKTKMHTVWWEPENLVVKQGQPQYRLSSMNEVGLETRSYGSRWCWWKYKKLLRKLIIWPKRSIRTKLFEINRIEINY